MTSPSAHDTMNDQRIKALSVSGDFLVSQGSKKHPGNCFTVYDIRAS